MPEIIEFVNGPADGDRTPIADNVKVREIAHVQSAVVPTRYHRYKRTNRKTRDGATIYEYMKSYNGGQPPSCGNVGFGR